MDTTSNRSQIHPPKPNRNWSGLILILIGVVFLLKRIPGIHEWIPTWIFTWPSILIVIGLFIGAKSRFQNIGSFILIGIGIFFLFENAHMIHTNLKPFILPAGLIILGIIVLTRRHQHPTCRNKNYRHFRHRHYPPPNPDSNADLIADDDKDSEDRLEVSSVFGNINRSLISKNFKGGNIAATFGGAEINLSKCDFQGSVTIDLSVAFGGVELVIPGNWKLHNEVNVILGGIEDKRNLLSETEGNTKTLTLRGSIICGVLELKSF